MDSNRVLLMWDELPLFNHLSWKHLFCMRYQLSLPQLKIELTWRCCVKLWHKLINELLLFATVRNSEISRFWHNLHTLICSITRVAAVCGSKKMYRATLSSFYASQPRVQFSVRWGRAKYCCRVHRYFSAKRLLSFLRCATGQLASAHSDLTFEIYFVRKWKTQVSLSGRNAFSEKNVPYMNTPSCKFSQKLNMKETKVKGL